MHISGPNCRRCRTTGGGVNSCGGVPVHCKDLPPGGWPCPPAPRHFPVYVSIHTDPTSGQRAGKLMARAGISPRGRADLHVGGIGRCGHWELPDATSSSSCLSRSSPSLCPLPSRCEEPDLAPPSRTSCLTRETSKTVNSDKPFFFKSWLSRAFCDADGKLCKPEAESVTTGAK